MMRFSFHPRGACAVFVFCSLLLSAGRAGSRLAELPERPRELTLAALARVDPLWDERAGLLWGSADSASDRNHGVRATTWYALGLLLRDQPGDSERAEQAFDAVLKQQVFEPGQPWDGTFYRRAEEPRPLQSARMWDDYDPNWRQFIGCVFAQALIDFPEKLPAALRERMEAAIARALEGELAHGRLTPGYTNIALMQGFLLGFAGQRLERPEWVAAAEQWVGEIVAEFATHESFEEYNSPTYYGVDLYGLALLRAAGATTALREAGASMEAALWRDIGRFYHAGLRNLAGPFDRTYGMDMTQYIALTGVWMGFVLPPEATPLPDLASDFKHAHDFLFTPCFALLGARVPDDARPHLEHFAGERAVTRPIAAGRRVATAWLGSDVMIGAEATAWSRGVPHARSQFHPATVHWRLPDGGIGWIALRDGSRLNATAEPSTLLVDAVGNAVFHIHAPGAAIEDCSHDRWNLPGLDARVETDALRWSARMEGEVVAVSFEQATRITLRVRRP